MKYWQWVAEGWMHREIYYLLAWRDVRLRYKQTVLGVFWAVLQPFLTMLLFSIVFGRIVNIGSDGIPYAIFYYAALLPWIYFSSTVTQSSLSLVNNARLVTKVYFPRSALPIAPALSGMVDLGIGTIILIVMMAYYGLHPTAKLFLWPVLVIMLACLSCTIGMVLSALNVRYRDVKHVVPFLLQLWLFATPIVYPANMIPEYLRFYMDLNPLTGIVAAFRTVCVPQQHTDWASLGFSAVVILLLLFVSVGYFSKAEQSFGDVL